MITGTKKGWLIFGITLVLFLGLRLPAVHAPYHQDEYKWPLYAGEKAFAPGSIPHPPLTEFIYRVIGKKIDFNNFRYIPLTFGLANLFLILYLVKTIFGKREALWATFLFSISFYSVLASLMVDVDGAIIPFFLLLMSIGYFKMKEFNWKSWKWAILLILGIVGGFLIKVVFLLPIIAFILDFAIEKQIFTNKRRFVKYVLSGIACLIALILILVGSKYIFPFFNLEEALKYWEHFAVFAGRGWLQTFIQFAKALLYTSPLLILPALLSNKEVWRRGRPFFFLIFIGILFYLFAFDFSIGALDRYFQFLVVPLCIISGAVFGRLQIIDYKTQSKNIAYIIFISLLIFSLQFFNHFTPPLYPKTEWISRIASLKWNFLFPFMGGSGPIPFYVSFLFMVISWIALLIVILPTFKNIDLRKKALIGILILGLTYNAVFIEEYLMGKINGSSRELVYDATSFIKKNADISMVTVYNDNGGWEVQNTGKYRKRLYIDPKFDISEKIKTLNKYKEHYLVIDIPHIDQDTIYAKYFSTCETVYKNKSLQINAFVYDCRNAPDLKE